MVCATSPLRAYTYDLLGSLLGVLAFTGAAALHSPPVVWFGLGLLPLAWVSRRWWAVFGIGVILLTGWTSQGAYFSPYNRVDLTSNSLFTEYGESPNPVARPEYRLSVNRDFHQDLLDLSATTVRHESPGTQVTHSEDLRNSFPSFTEARPCWSLEPALVMMLLLLCGLDLFMFPVSKLIR